ncbi:hypothetical protein BLA29_011373 [Euroglyphus maynei]|uniref:Peptidase aspartic putative domain-containing protein n=1 Tax=Euroglyphus maynei TaxID=6958 RepID=A0A1Y3B0X8_EURMA|nr:hypothetical protein BLA29_011373 [Euroglyphus maynei]
MDTLSHTEPTVTGHQMTKIAMPIWNGEHKELEFRINDKLEKLYFDCIASDQQQSIRNQNINFHDAQQQVDMLIGLDNINQIQLAEEKRLSKDVIAKRTTIGWVVFGQSMMTNILLNVNQAPIVESALD